jgi:transposase InsO family protein
MPWEEATVMQKRKEFVGLATQEDANISQLCERFQISRKTGYKWLARFREEEEAGLEDRSRSAHYRPNQSSGQIEEAVLRCRQKHPAWGGRKIAHVLLRDEQLSVAPSTVTSILHRHHLIRSEASEAATAWQRFEHAQPNALWQMDFKGHFAVQSQRCHPLTVLDDHSRYNVVLAACANEHRKTVQYHLEQAFERYGLPMRINTDNGSPWGTAEQGRFTKLGIWLIRLGIKVSHSRPFHPQTNGKDERFHRSLKAEVLAHRQFANFSEVQKEFDQWRLIYNAQRPHEALSMQTPLERYRPSPQPFPKTLPPIEYGPDDQVRKVNQCGRFRFKGKTLRISKALHGQSIGIRPRNNQEGVFDIYFCRQWIDSVDLTTGSYND